MFAEFGSIDALAEIGVFQKLLAAYQRVYPGVATCAATTRLNAAVADASLASLTSAVNGNVPLTEVVPAITPPEDRLMPLGNWPPANDQV
jgi:hypothetical protein